MVHQKTMRMLFDSCVKVTVVSVGPDMSMLKKRKAPTGSEPVEQQPVAEDAEEEAQKFLEEAQQKVDFHFSPIHVLPGDDVTLAITKTTKTLKLGAGLQQIDDHRVISVNAGVLRYRPPNRYWVEFNHKRYVASVGDGVIGIITDRNAEFYRVNIGSSSQATLGCLAFDGASKRNRPNLRVGSLVYARISKTSREMEPELTCEAPAHLPKKDWMTGLAIYGELTDGLVVKISIGYARRLLREGCYLMESLAQSRLPFELTIGSNGMLWIKSKSHQNTVVLANLFLNCEAANSPSEIQAIVDQLLRQTVMD